MVRIPGNKKLINPEFTSEIKQLKNNFCSLFLLHDSSLLECCKVSAMDDKLGFRLPGDKKI